MRRRRGRSFEHWDKVIGLLLLFLGIFALGGIGYSYFWLQKTHVEIVEATNCPTTGPRAIHIIIIDRTDPVTPQQAQRIKQRIFKLVHEAITAQRFDLYTIEGDSKSVYLPILQICSPGRGKDANELYQNPEQIERRFQEKFVATIERTIDQLLRDSTLPNSPIVESIKGAAITSFGPASNQNIPLAMTIVSDMVQHSTMMSQFRSEPLFSDVSKSTNWRTLKPDLYGAEVDVLYLLRSTAKRANGSLIQNRVHQLFWEQLVTAGNGHIISFDIF